MANKPLFLDVRYAILDLWSLLPSRETTRHANKVLAACTILRLFVVLFKKANLWNAIWCNNKGQNPIYPFHRSDILVGGPNMHDARLSRPKASLNSLSVYFSNVKQLDLILMSCQPRCSRGSGLSTDSSARWNQNVHILCFTRRQPRPLLLPRRQIIYQFV